MRRKERRTTEDHEGTEVCGFMDVVLSWLLVQLNTTHLRWRACCSLPRVGWALVGQAYGCSSPGSPVEGTWPACSCSFPRRTPEVLESYGGFHSHFLMRDRKGGGKGVRHNRAKLSTSNFHHGTQFKQASFHSLACTRMHNFHRHLLWSFHSSLSAALHTVPVSLHHMQPLNTVLSVLEYCNHLSPRMCSFNSMFPHHFTQLSPPPPLIHLYQALGQHTLSYTLHQTKPD